MRIVNPKAVLGEDLAEKYLKSKGYKILERNFRKGYGEIDIIALKDDTLVFVEVKTRTSTKFGTPFEAISPFKLKALERTALFYKNLHPELPSALRIEAVSVLLDEVSKKGKIDLTVVF
jgi:putative endonuclease